MAISLVYESSLVPRPLSTTEMGLFPDIWAQKVL